VVFHNRVLFLFIHTGLHSRGFDVVNITVPSGVVPPGQGGLEPVPHLGLHGAFLLLRNALDSIEHVLVAGQVNGQGEELAKEYPKDIPLQIMHALRIGLCTKIEQGTITYEEAVALMNDMMENLKAQREEQELPEKENL
jgi:hypothetical protein